jgi:7-cyano-7-deazaguanine reductase
MMDFMEPLLLGKTVDYIDVYTPHLLCPISRDIARSQKGISLNPLPFFGGDVWNAYEVSWLDKKGKPIVAMLSMSVPAQSPFLVESKSFKLYLNSFNMTHFSSEKEVASTMQSDLESVLKTKISLSLDVLSYYQPAVFHPLRGMCIDHLDLTVDKYEVDPKFLTCNKDRIEECIYSNLLRSNCPMTHQPDWASVEISYRGRQIHYAGLLKYLISYRKHCSFHEAVVEEIFCDILKRCEPESLTVQARFTRRGGIDINPYRSTELHFPENIRLCRQ